MAGYWFKSILSIFIAASVSTFSLAQTITTGKDSAAVAVAPAADTLTTGILGGLKKWDKPSRAALYSTIIPGGGQVYNKRLWKVPIIYAGGATIGYFLVKWHKNYLLFRSSYDILTDGKPETVDSFIERWPNVTPEERARRLALGRDTYRRYRDLNIVFAVLLYGLQISEAYVDAHLKGFDVSDQLSMRLEPTIIPGPFPMSYTPGLAMRFNLKK